MSVSMITSRNMLYWNFCCAAPILYCLPSFFTLIATVILNRIRESLFHVAEVIQSANENEQSYTHRDPQPGIGTIPHAQQCPAETVHHTRHRVQHINQL